MKLHAFAHGQLFVAASRVGRASDLAICAPEIDGQGITDSGQTYTRNIVCPKVLHAVNLDEQRPVDDGGTTGHQPVSEGTSPDRAIPWYVESGVLHENEIDAVEHLARSHADSSATDTTAPMPHFRNVRLAAAFEREWMAQTARNLEAFANSSSPSEAANSGDDFISEPLQTFDANDATESTYRVAWVSRAAAELCIAATGSAATSPPASCFPTDTASSDDGYQGARRRPPTFSFFWVPLMHAVLECIDCNLQPDDAEERFYSIAFNPATSPFGLLNAVAAAGGASEWIDIVRVYIADFTARGLTRASFQGHIHPSSGYITAEIQEKHMYNRIHSPGSTQGCSTVSDEFLACVLHNLSRHTSDR